MNLDTTNDFGASIQGPLVVFQRPIARGMTFESALRLCAHIVAQLDDSANHIYFGRLLQAVEARYPKPPTEPMPPRLALPAPAPQFEAVDDLVESF